MSIGGWTVSRGVYGLATAVEISWKRSNSAQPEKKLPVIGILAEYDALVFPGVPALHACGHNLIALNAITTATLVREAVEHVGHSRYFCMTCSHCDSIS